LCKRYHILISAIDLEFLRLTRIDRYYSPSVPTPTPEKLNNIINLQHSMSTVECYSTVSGVVPPRPSSSTHTVVISN